MYAYCKLTYKQSKFIKDSIELGDFSTPSEIIRAAVREMKKEYKGTSWSGN